MTPSQHLSSSATLSAATHEEVTFETILSDENKRRCQSRLLSMKPVRRFTWLDKSRDIEKAAVLVLLCMVDGKPSILFTERSNQLYMHRGEISFPGGKADDTDRHLSHTALREAEEEIGLCREKVDIWGEMLPVPGRKFNITVTPIVACYSGELDLASLKLNRHEVECVFAPSIEALCHADNNHYTCFRVQEMMTRETLKKYQDVSTNETFVMPVYVAGNRRIWGLTAIMLHQVLRVVAGGLYTPKIGLMDWLRGRNAPWT